MDPTIVSIDDEDGNTIEYTILDVVDHNERSYALLVPAGCENDEDGEVTLMRYAEESDEQIRLTPIEDDAELQSVVDYITSLGSEEGDEE